MSVRTNDIAKIIASGMKPELVLVVALFVEHACYGLPEVLGFRTEIYVSDIPKPGQMAFASDGRLFVGNGADSGRLRCVPIGGGRYSETGEPVSDPDPVAVDELGRLLEPAGLLLTGGDVGSRRGTIWAVTPCGQLPSATVAIVGPSTSIGNAGTFHWHPTAGLIFCRTTTDSSGAIMALSKGFGGVLNVQTLAALGAGFDTGSALAVGGDGAIVKASNDGNTLRFFSGSGEKVKDLNVSALELGPYPFVTYGNGSDSWGGSLYAVSIPKGKMYRIDEIDGHGVLVGTGFSDIGDLQFRPNGELFVSEWENGRIVRLAPLAGPELEVFVSGVSVRWRSVLGRRYIVEVFGSETGDWLPMFSEPMVGTGGILVAEDKDVESRQHRRYRLVVAD